MICRDHLGRWHFWRWTIAKLPPSVMEWGTDADAVYHLWGRWYAFRYNK